MGKFRLEPSLSWLMVLRADAQHEAGLALESRDEIKYRLSARRDEQLGREIRKILREFGYERDCEIDSDMAALANEARRVIERLDCHILNNSPVCADLIRRHLQ